jgi:hypothetical protein
VRAGGSPSLPTKPPTSAVDGIYTAISPTHRTLTFTYRSIIMPPSDIIPPLLRKRLLDLEQQDVHYESLFAGHHNSFLQCHFTLNLKEGFLVSPEPRLRTLVPTDSTGRPSPDSDRSHGSGGQPVATNQRGVFPGSIVSTMETDRPRTPQSWYGS